METSADANGLTVILADAEANTILAFVRVDAVLLLSSSEKPYISVSSSEHVDA